MVFDHACLQSTAQKRLNVRASLRKQTKKNNSLNMIFKSKRKILSL